MPTRTTTQYEYRPQDYTQDQINAGQRNINYALTQADKALIEVLTTLKEAIQAPPGQVQSHVDEICRAIDAATKAINHVATIRPPGCDETWKPEPGRDETWESEESWVRFEGTAEAHGRIVWLKPSQDASVTLRIRMSDVRIEGSVVVVRVGATIANLSSISPDDSTAMARTLSSSAKRECDDNPTACVGAIELCCHTGKVIGSCMGYWRCPK